MHPILRQQLKAVLGQPKPEKARLEALVESVHHQYRRYEKELIALERRLADHEAETSRSKWHSQGDEGLRILLDNIKDGIISVDALGRIRSMNVTAERMFGRESAELVGQSLGRLLVIPGTRRESTYLSELSRIRENTQLDLSPSSGVGRRADGRQFPLDLVASATEVAGEKIYVLAIRDISERLEAERALRESEARYRSLVDSAPEAIVVLDPITGNFADANEKALRLLKIGRTALLANGPVDFSPQLQPDGRTSEEAAKACIEAAMNGATDCFEWQHQDAQGELIPCEVRLVKIEFGGRAMVRASIMDIRERKRAERQSAGERTILELIASNAPLEEVLTSIANTVTGIAPGICPALYVLDENFVALQLLAGPGLPETFRDAVGRIRFTELDHQSKSSRPLDETVCMADIGTAQVWAAHRELALRHGFHGCWSAPIRDADGRVLGAFATYLPAEKIALTHHLDLFDRMMQLAGIAIARKRDERALRLSERRYRGTLREGARRRLPGVRRRPVHRLQSRRSCRCSGYDSEAELHRPEASTVRAVRRSTTSAPCSSRRSTARATCATPSCSLRRKDGREIVVLETARTVCDAARQRRRPRGHAVGHHRAQAGRARGAGRRRSAPRSR
jgi:PAS domain S-box-containing protein